MFPLALLVLGAGALLALATSSPSRSTMNWVDRVIARVSKHEANDGPRSLNLNRDGAGLSFGILQWAQKPGSLGRLLAEMQRSHPERFAAVFGPDWRELLTVTATKGSLAPVGGSVLWSGPWPARFKAAGNDPELAAVQVRVAQQGEHFMGALRAADVLGVKSERSLALLFDTAVQQGPTKAVAIASDVVRSFLDEGRNAVPAADLLARYAARCAAPFRRTTEPTSPYPSSHIAWRKTGDEWHAWAGSFDLFADITRRRSGILRDPALSDDPLTA